MKVSFQFLFLFGILSMFFASPSMAQEPGTHNMEILAEKVKADKKLVIAMNMNLNDVEAKAFWPVYDAYQVELSRLNNRLETLIINYAKAYSHGTISDEIAVELIKEWVHVEAEEMKLWIANVKKIGQVLSAQKVARYLQMENKIRAILDFSLAAEIPLIH